MAFGSKNRIRVQAGVEGVPQAAGELNKFRAAFDKVASSKGGQAILGGVGLGAGIGAFNVLEGAISKVVDIGSEAVQKASDLRESMAITEQVFDANTDAVEEWAKASDDAFSQSEAMSFAAQFGTAFKNVGLALDDTTAKAEAMTTLAGDLGSAFNRGSDEAANALRSGLLGESEPLRAFGVFLDEAKVKAKAAAMGMKPLNGALSDGQKVAARYALIMEQTADSQGMFGRDTDSLADASKRLNSNITDLETMLATKAIPTLATFAGAAADAAAAATKPGGPVDQAANVWSDFLALFDGDPFYEPRSGLGRFSQEVDDAASNAVDFLTPWDEYTDAAADRERALSDHTDNMRELNRATYTNQTAAEGAAAFWSGGFVRASQTAAEAAAAAAAAMVEANHGAKRSFEDLSDFLNGEYTSNFNTAMDTVTAQEDLSAEAAERAALRKKLASGDLTTRQRADAWARMDVLDVESAHNYQKLSEMGTLDAQGYDAWAKTLERLAKGTKGKVHESFMAAIRDVQALKAAAAGNIKVSVTYKSPRPGQAPVANATGGYIPPGTWGTVGEEGVEGIHMLPGGGAYVTSRDQYGGGGGAASSNGGAPVVFQVNLDGRTIAEVVDRHLSYAAARAPRSGE